MPAAVSGWSAVTVIVRRGGQGLGRLRQAEIQQHRAALRQHDVAWLDVAMDEAGLVRGGEAAGNLCGVLQGLLQRKLAAAQPVGQSFPVEKFQNEEINAILAPNVVHRAHVRMRQRRDRSRFALEALQRHGIVRRHWTAGP